MNLLPKTSSSLLKKPGRVLCICLLLAVCSSPAFAVRPYRPVNSDPVLEPWRWRSFPELAGLGLRGMVEDRTGNIWFGTDNGVRRYDGLYWTAYTTAQGLDEGPVNALLVTREGILYAGTRRGICRFSGGKWSRIFPQEIEASVNINDLLEASDGSIWAGTYWGAFRLRAGQATVYTTRGNGKALQVWMPGLEVIAAPDHAVPALPWAPSQSTGIGVAGIPVWQQGSGPSIPSLVVTEIASGSPGETAGLKPGDRIVAIDGQAGVTADRLSGKEGTQMVLQVRRQALTAPFEMTVTRKPVQGTFHIFPIWDICEARNGAIWFGLHDGEIVRHVPPQPETSRNGSWRMFTADDGLRTGEEPHLIQTRDGAIWTASETFDGGANRFSGKTWTHTDLSLLGGININTFLRETRDGTLWVGGHHGYLHAYKNGLWSVYRSPQVPLPEVRAIDLLEASDGSLWIPSRGQGVLRLDFATSQWVTYEGLIFQCETPDGSQWFLADDNGVVRNNGGRWRRFGVEDGLIEAPLALFPDREGRLWVTGSHDSTAATARFNGSKWVLQTHPRLSWGIGYRAVYASSDSSLWFGAEVDRFPDRGQIGGILQFNGQAWTHHSPPKTQHALYGIGQTADGNLWFGGYEGMRSLQEKGWTAVTDPEVFKFPSIDVIHSTPQGHLWVGTRTYGLFHYDGKTWRRSVVQDGLAEGRIRSVIQTTSGIVWVLTQKDISRFDGRAWAVQKGSWPTLLDDLGYLLQSKDGALWINRFSKQWGKRARPGSPVQNKSAYGLKTFRYIPNTRPPETTITVSLKEVSQPGNTTLAWKAVDPWRDTPEAELQYAWRLDGGQWSPFSAGQSRLFSALPSGRHTFEVKARDRDFNEDLTPALLQFTVVPPTWQQPWFIGLMAVLTGLVSIQTGRVILRDRRLRKANEELEDRVQERTQALGTTNRQLQVEIDERRQAEQEREALIAELGAKNAELERFTYTVSHDLKSPLITIKGFLGLLQKDATSGNPKRLEGDIRQISDAADNMHRLLDELLELSRIGRIANPSENVSLTELANEAVKLVAGQIAAGSVDTQIAPDLPVVSGDRARLLEVFQNLLENAIKFMGNQPAPQIKMGVRKEKGESVVFVSDNGIGIDRKYHKKVFELFDRLDTEVAGTGIGLALVKRIVESHGGRIWVESEGKGTGSTFCFTLPSKGEKTEHGTF